MQKQKLRKSRLGEKKRKESFFNSFEETKSLYPSINGGWKTLLRSL